MEVIQVFNRPASQMFYSVAGRLLFIECFDPELRDLIVELFAGWQLTAVSLPDSSPDIRISFSCEQTHSRAPHNLNQFEIAEGGRCYTNGAELYLELGSAVVHLEQVSSVTVKVSFSELPRFRDPLVGRAVSFAVCAALRRYGIFDLHSAGVVEPESGKAVLIVGPSGSGKSTLALQLATSGWSYLSDDELLLSLVSGAVEARGFRSFFAVSEAGAQFKRCFEPQAVLGLKRTDQASPASFFFIRLNRKSSSQMTKLSQADAMKRLIRACPWATYDRSIASDNLQLLSALAHQARGFDLSAGRDLFQPGFAAEMLKGVLTSP
jgi:hypothetical protein